MTIQHYAQRHLKCLGGPLASLAEARTQLADQASVTKLIENAIDDLAAMYLLLLDAADDMVELAPLPSMHCDFVADWGMAS